MSGCVLTLPGSVQARDALPGNVYLYKADDGRERPYLCVCVGLETKFVCLAADSSWEVVPLGPNGRVRSLGPLRVEGDALY